MHLTLLASVTIASVLSSALPLAAQTIGQSNGIGGSSVSGSSMSAAGFGDSAPRNAPNWPPTPWPPSLGSATNDVDGSATGGSGNASGNSTQQRATEGSSSVNSVNADAVARSGNFGAATRIGANPSSSTRTANNTTFQSVAGTGPEALYNIPVPRVSVDLAAIRAAIRKGPNSTPDHRGY